MKMVKIEEKDEIAIVRLSNGVTNPIGSQLVDDLSATLDEIKDHKKGMVLAGGEKFFSIGLNLPELVKLDRPGMVDFWTRFNNVNLKLYTLPLVTACAITGHAPAGGTVFALNCDYRFAAEGKPLLGLLEITLGLPVPYLTELILRQVVNNREANDILYMGAFFSPAKGKEINLIDEVYPQAEVELKAIEKIESIAKHPLQALAAMKQTKTEGIRLKYNKFFTKHNEAFIDCWFSKESRKLLEKAVEKF